MSYNWKPGMKAVCIDASGKAYSLVVGAVYDVEGVIECTCGLLMLSLVGVRPNGAGWSGWTRCTCAVRRHGEWSAARRFRPLDELELTMDRLEKEGAPIEEPQPAFA